METEREMEGGREGGREVGGWVGGWVGGGAEAHHGGEPGVPGARGHAQDPPDMLCTPTRRLTTYHHLSPPFCFGVGGYVVGGGGGCWWGARGRTAVVSRGSLTVPSHEQPKG
jgi:hypothetical protein